MKITSPLEEKLVGMVISDVLGRWPRTLSVFQARRMACVGCAVSSCCTVADAANEYSISLCVLLNELITVICETYPEDC